MNELTEAYEGLKRLRLCKTGYQFSQEYLGRAPNYYSVVKSGDKEPSLAVLTMLYYSLVEKSSLLAGSRDAVIIRTKSELNTIKKE